MIEKTRDNLRIELADKSAAAYSDDWYSTLDDLNKLEEKDLVELWEETFNQKVKLIYPGRIYQQKDGTWVLRDSDAESHTGDSAEELFELAKELKLTHLFHNTNEKPTPIEKINQKWLDTVK